MAAVLMAAMLNLGHAGSAAAQSLPVTAFFAAPTATVGEGDGTVSLTIRLSAPAPAGGIKVGYETRGRNSAGGASAGDYVSPSANDREVTIPAGDDSITVMVGITNDDIVEGDEIFDVALYVPRGVTGLVLDPARSSAAVTITDDDAPAPAVTATLSGPASVDEDATTGGTARHTVTLAPAPTSAVTVGWAVTNGGTAPDATATDAADFTGGSVTQLMVELERFHSGSLLGVRARHVEAFVVPENVSAFFRHARAARIVM